MKLSHLSDQTLLQNTFLLVKKEKEILGEILSHLEEVRRRRLFCELGYGSLFQYCVKQLGYSEDQSYRRINALKLIKEVPEVHAQIAQGEISLSSLAVAQSLFKVEKSVDKKAVLKALKNKSKREAELIVRSFSPKIQERKKEITLSLSLTQSEKWNAVKAKLAHCNLTEEEILERLCDAFLAPKPTKPKPRSRIAKDTIPTNPEKKSAPPRSSAPKPTENTSIISRPLRRAVFQKSYQSCTNCGSNYALEIDHRVPKAAGGSNHSSNLRALCRPCNQRAAIKSFGMKKMQKYLEKPRT